MRYLLLILSLLVAQPAAAIIIKQGPGGSGDASVRSAADCTAETGGTEDEVCVETGTGQGVFRCSTATCEGAGWERADDTVGAGGGIVNDITADVGGTTTGANITLSGQAGMDTTRSVDTILISFDPTELVDLAWGTGVELDWTFNGGAVDPVLTVGSDSVAWVNVATFTLDTNQVLTDATTFVGDVGGTSGATVIQADSVEATMVAFPFALADGELIDMTLVVPNTATEGLILPQIGSACAGATANGQICYDTAGNDLYIGNGAGVDQMNVGGGSGAFSDAGDPVVLNTITKDTHMGDGAGTLAGKVEIGGDADQPQLVIEGFSTQTDDILIIQNDADSEVFSVSNTGAITAPSVSGNAGTVTFADAAADTTTFVALGTAATGSLAPATDAGMAYNASTNALTVTGAVDTGAHTATSYTADASATPTWSTQDSDMGGTPDQNTLVIANCPTGTTAGGNEDCDLAFQTQVAGTPTEAFRIDTTDGGTQTVVFTADPVFPADAVITADITNSNVTEDKLAATLTFDDDDLIDLSAINLSDGAEGLILPQNGTACTLAIGDGQICYDTAANNLWIGNGVTVDQMNAAGANSFGIVTDGSTPAGSDSAGDTLTVTDSATINFVTSDAPEDLTASIVADSVDQDELAATVTMGATDLITFAAWNNTDGNGLIVPNHATDCTNVLTEGQLCWEQDAELLWVGDGTGGPTSINGGSGGETLAQTLALGADGNDVDMTSLGRLEFFDAGLYFDADADGVMDITSDGTLELHSADWDISTTGVITGAGNITSDGTVTAVTVSGNAAADLDIDANGQNVTLGDGGTTNYVAVADAGTVTFAGTAGIYTDSTVSIPAAAWVLSTTPPTEATYGTNYPESVLDFATDADDQAFIKLAIPTDFNDTNQANMTWVIRWTADTATTGDTCFCIAADPLQNGDDPDLNTGTVTSCADVTVVGADDLEETTFTMSASTFETAEMMNVRLYRDVDAGAAGCTADDMADDASVFAVTLNYGVLKQ